MERNLIRLRKSLQIYIDKWEEEIEDKKCDRDVCIQRNACKFVAQWIINSINGGLGKHHATNICKILDDADLTPKEREECRGITVYFGYEIGEPVYYVYKDKMSHVAYVGNGIIQGFNVTKVNGEIVIGINFKKYSNIPIGHVSRESSVIQGLVYKYIKEANTNG